MQDEFSQEAEWYVKIVKRLAVHLTPASEQLTSHVQAQFENVSFRPYHHKH